MMHLEKEISCLLHNPKVYYCLKLLHQSPSTSMQFYNNENNSTQYVMEFNITYRHINTVPYVT